MVEDGREMAAQIDTHRASWLAIGIVTLGVAAIIALSRTGAFATSPEQHLLAVMGSARYQQTPAQGPFTGAEATAVMGSCVLDLTHAQMSPGAEAVVELFALMGSVTIRVPNDWTVDARAVPVMGSVHDQRWVTRNADGGAPAASVPPRLVLRGVVMMGGVIIKS